MSYICLTAELQLQEISVEQVAAYLEVIYRTQETIHNSWRN